jgi:hypothetical protein
VIVDVDWDDHTVQYKQSKLLLEGYVLLETNIAESSGMSRSNWL